MKFGAPIKHDALSRRGITLLLTMLALVLSVTVLSRQMLRTTVLRLSSTSTTFGVEAQWIAEGVARQWRQQSGDPMVKIDDLLRPVFWEVRSDASDIPTTIEVFPSSSQNKLYLPDMIKEDWMDFWQRQSTGVALVDVPDAQLLEGGNTALEVILSTKHISAQDVYLPAPGHGQSGAPADVMTVWGDGRMDLNRASREVLQTRLKSFTDAQLSGILRIRASGPVKDLSQINDELSLSEDQSRLLSNIAAYAPNSLELVIRIRHGGLSAVYFSVITVGNDGRVLEVRPIL